MPQNKIDDEVLVVGYGPGAQYLTEKGFPTSKSLLSKLSSPAISEGPEIEAYWNGRPAFRPSALEAWARGRLKPASEARARKAIPVAATTSTTPAPRRPGRPRKQPALPSAPVAASLPTQPKAAPAAASGEGV